MSIKTHFENLQDFKVYPTILRHDDERVKDDFPA